MTDYERDARLLLAGLEEKYFKDMTLEEFSESKITAIYLEKRGLVYCDLPYISIVRKYSIHLVKPSGDVKSGEIGACDIENKKILLYEGRCEGCKKITLLHEMIHAYDAELSMYPTWRDFVLLYLYEKLANSFIKKKRLWKIIELESHPEFFIGIDHNPLFVLKSLDLDWRLGKKPGTVCGYGRKKYY